MPYPFGFFFFAGLFGGDLTAGVLAADFAGLALASLFGFAAALVASSLLAAFKLFRLPPTNTGGAGGKKMIWVPVTPRVVEFEEVRPPARLMEAVSWKEMVVAPGLLTTI